ARCAPAGGDALQERRDQVAAVLRRSGHEGVTRQSGPEAGAEDPGRKASCLSGRATAAAPATPASTRVLARAARNAPPLSAPCAPDPRSEEHTSELQSRVD